MLATHDITLLLLAAATVAAIIFLIAKLKVHPLPALMACTLALGLLAGETVPAALKSFGQGFGDTLANVGIVLALGAMFGWLLNDSRGADRIAAVLVGTRGPRFAPWAMALLAMLLGLPMFFETGVVMMMPIIIAVGLRLQADPARDPAVSPFLLAGLPAIAGLSVLHGLVPPHPGPLVAISALHADLGLTLLLGIVVAVPTVIVAGPLFGIWVARRATANPPLDAVAMQQHGADARAMPGTGVTIATILFPITLMLAKAGADLALPADARLRPALDFIGAPMVALLLGVMLASVTFGFALGRTREQVSHLLGDALPPVSAIMLIIGAGGGLKQTLVDVGLGTAMGHAAALTHVPPLVLGWGTAVLIRIATGSATVATVTAAGLLTTGATLGGGGTVDASLMALAIGAGSVFFSNVNDAGFWLVKGVLGISLPDMFKTWSALETIISVVGLALVLLLSAIL